MKQAPATSSASAGHVPGRGDGDGDGDGDGTDTHGVKSPQVQAPSSPNDGLPTPHEKQDPFASGAEPAWHVDGKGDGEGDGKGDGEGEGEACSKALPAAARPVKVAIAAFNSASHAVRCLVLTRIRKDIQFL